MLCNYINCNIINWNIQLINVLTIFNFFYTIVLFEKVYIVFAVFQSYIIFPYMLFNKKKKYIALFMTQYQFIKINFLNDQYLRVMCTRNVIGIAFHIVICYPRKKKLHFSCIYVPARSIVSYAAVIYCYALHNIFLRKLHVEYICDYYDSLAKELYLISSHMRWRIRITIILL